MTEDDTSTTTVNPQELCPEGYAWCIGDCDFGGDCDNCSISTLNKEEKE